MNTSSPTRGDAKEMFVTGPLRTVASLSSVASLKDNSVLKAPPRLQKAKEVKRETKMQENNEKAISKRDIQNAIKRLWSKTYL